MASDPSSRPVLRAVLLGVGATVFLVVLATAWLVTRPVEAQACTAAGSFDPVGAPTPEEARVRWLEGHDVEVDAAHPDDVDRSDDSETAIYVLDSPTYGPPDPTRTYERKVVVERDSEGTWRVTSANACERWTE